MNCGEGNNLAIKNNKLFVDNCLPKKNITGYKVHRYSSNTAGCIKNSSPNVKERSECRIKFSSIIAHFKIFHENSVQASA